MPTAAPGSVYGDNCKAYYSATLGDAGTLIEIPVAIDDTISSERRSAESNCRGDAEISEHLGKPKHSISMNLLAKRGTPGTTYVALRTAYFNGTVLHWALATGTITDETNQVVEIEGKIKKWDESHPDNDSVKVSIEITRDASSTFATEFSVVAGA
jgi:hypothetical protein